MDVNFKSKHYILLFDRCELTHLFADLGDHLINNYNIIHLAYSEVEAKILHEKKALGEIIIFKNEIKEIYKKEEINKELLKHIDCFFIKNTDGRFNLNSSIQSDRGFSILSYNETLMLAQVYYKFWDDIFNKFKIKYVFHEPPSLFFNHMCAVMCKQYEAYYLYRIMTRKEKEGYCYINVIGDNYNAVEIENSYNFYVNNTNKIDVERCKKFLSEFRKDYTVFLGNMIKTKKRLYYWLRGQMDYIIVNKNKNKYDRIIDNIDFWLLTQKFNLNKYSNLINYKKHIKYDQINSEDDYYYYSMHLEPESVVLYLGDGIYSNQVKLIENIAASLPVGCYLYVKDHPHENGYRLVDDYIKLQKIPNIKLIDPTISGKNIIKNSIGVFTINGTAGFEALLLNKQVYVFGRSYYTACRRVKIISNIRDIKSIVYANKDVCYTDDEELYTYIYSYLKNLHPGIVDFFMNRAAKYGVGLEENAAIIAKEFLKLSQTLC